MFLGIYALGVTIIGYQYASIDRREWATYAVASILLMVLDLALLVVDELLGLFGLPGPVTVLHDGRASTGRAGRARCVVVRQPLAGARKRYFIYETIFNYVMSIVFRFFRFSHT